MRDDILSLVYAAIDDVNAQAGEVVIEKNPEAVSEALNTETLERTIA